MLAKFFRISIVVVFLLVGAIDSTAQQETVIPQGITVTQASGGGISIEGSSLEREYITIHDPFLKADLSGTPGIKTYYDHNNDFWNYLYEAEFTISVDEPLYAIEIRFLTFNIWGEYVNNCSDTEIWDSKSGETKKFKIRWEISWNEYKEHYASIAYISRVRTSTGQVLNADLDAVVEEARKFSDKFTEADLNPGSEKLIEGSL